MKKATFFILFFVFVLAIFSFPGLTQAKEPSFSIKNFSANYEEGVSKISGAFEISNNDSQTYYDLRYELGLHKIIVSSFEPSFEEMVDPQNWQLVALYPSKNPITIGANSQQPISYSIEIPANRPEGQYVIELKLYFGETLIPGRSFSRFINVEGKGQFLSIQQANIVRDNFFYNPDSRVDFSALDTLQISLIAFNNGLDAVNAYARAQVFKDSRFGEEIASFKGESAPFSIALPSPSYKLNIGPLNAAGIYVAKVQFYKADSDLAVSAPVYFNFLIRGESAQILEISTDKESYKKGEVVKTLVKLSRSADLFILDSRGNRVENKERSAPLEANLKVQLLDAKGKKIISEYSKNILLSGNQEVPVELTADKNLSSYQIKAFLEKNSQILAEKTITSQNTQPVKWQYFLIGGLLILFFILIAVFIKKKNTASALLLSLVLIFGALVISQLLFSQPNTASGLIATCDEGWRIMHIERTYSDMDRKVEVTTDNPSAIQVILCQNYGEPDKPSEGSWWTWYGNYGCEKISYYMCNFSAKKNQLGEIIECGYEKNECYWTIPVDNGCQRKNGYGRCSFEPGTDGNYCGGDGCSASGPPPPGAPPSPPPPPPPPPTCSVSFTPSSINSGEATSLKWTGNRDTWQYYLEGGTFGYSYQYSFLQTGTLSPRCACDTDATRADCSINFTASPSDPNVCYDQYESNRQKVSNKFTKQIDTEGKLEASGERIVSPEFFSGSQLIRIEFGRKGAPVCSAQVALRGSPPPPPPPPPPPLPGVEQTLSVSLSANPSSGNPPLISTITANVGGTATGTINYTFYCDRDDNGTDITSPWSAKFDNISETTKSITCNYGQLGSYHPKVIVERGSASPATDKKTVVVFSSNPRGNDPPPGSSPPPGNNPPPAVSSADVTVEQSLNSSDCKIMDVATFSWTYSGGPNTSFEVRIKEAGTSGWTYYAAPSSPYTISNLSAGSYQWQIRSTSGNQSTLTPAQPGQFSIQGAISGVTVNSPQSTAVINQPVTLTAIVNALLSPFTAAWNFGASATIIDSNANSATVKFNSAGAKSVKYQITNSPLGICTASKTIVVGGGGEI